MAFLKSNLQRYGTLSTLLFLVTILNAFRQRSNFYSAAVYLSKSNACMMILWNQAVFQTILFGRFLQHLFFGPLRPLEVERLQERGWFAVTETLLALTIFRDEFDTTFIMLFISLLFLKVFHWLAADRIELMEQSTSVSRLFHYRMTALLSILWIVNGCFLAYAAESIITEGPTVMIMFASEYMILVATVWSMTMKYGVNVIDLRTEDVWEEKSMYVFYIDLATDFFKLITYIVFFGLILTFYGLPLNILRDVYITLRSFILKCRDLKRYRQATKNMNALYPDASGEEMLAMVDKTCIICREDMEYRGAPINPPVPVPAEAAIPPPPVEPTPPPRSGPNDTPKKLPCGHVFHFHCLRSWLERQQSCPTCRRPVLPGEQTRATPIIRPVDGGDQLADGVDPVWQARVNLARNLGREAFAVVFPGVEFPPEAEGAEPIPPVVPAPAPIAGLAPPVVNGVPRPIAVTPGIRLPRNGILPTGLGAGTENPLARFTLPALKLPPAGEAGLYTSPGVASGYAGIAYGAFHGNGQGTGIGSGSGLTPPNLRPIGYHPTTGKTLNLEERVNALKGKGTGASTAEPTVELSVMLGLVKELGEQQRKIINLKEFISLEKMKLESLAAELTGPWITGLKESMKEAIKKAEESLVEARTGLEIINNKVRAEMVNVQLITDELLKEEEAKGGESVPVVEGSLKQTAIAAAERRAIASRVSALRAEGLPSTSASTTPMATPPITTPPTPTLAAKIPNGLEESTLPRLIPLFNPASPHSTTLYPHLLARLPPSHRTPPTSHPRSFNSTPLFNRTATEGDGEAEKEVIDLTKGILETKLRRVLKYQEEMEKLAKSMQKEFDGNESVEEKVGEVEKEKVVEKVVVDLKGKARMEE